MMTQGDLAQILTKNAKGYRNSNAGHVTVRDLASRPIDAVVAIALISPLLALCEREVENEVAVALRRRLEQWAPTALESIQRNDHMNEANGCTALTRSTADALIVDFVNFACRPLDLALYTSDLQA